jgi:hypothetical protein
MVSVLDIGRKAPFLIYRPPLLFFYCCPSTTGEER